MASVPYHLVKVCGDIVFAAQGSTIHSLSSSFQPLSTWKHPSQQSNGTATATPDPTALHASEGPPSKRRRVEKDNKQPGTDKKVKGVKSISGWPPRDRPFFRTLTVTPDGRHLIATTGSDKTIWVFEHDGAGNLKQLSSRQMPKRPCAIALTPDTQGILSADKFGDVYLLPLLPPLESLSPRATETPTPATPSVSTATSTPTASTPASNFKPQASELTVHTKRNLKALENQKLGLESKKKLDRPAEGPTFEHHLLLGHVSVLTDIAVGLDVQQPGSGRWFILTADRDEHIKVSRGPRAHAHVIHCYCGGHEEFVSRLCIPDIPGKGHLLISGGGDDSLFVWDWRAGKKLSRPDILGPAKTVMGADTEDVAVTRIAVSSFSLGPGEEEVPLVIVACERVPALFLYSIQEDNTLHFIESIPTPGNPLDFEFLPSPSKTPSRLLIAVDPNGSTTEQDQQPSSLLLLERDVTSGTWKQTAVSGLPVSEENIGEAELQKLLYTTESLRKLVGEDEM